MGVVSTEPIVGIDLGTTNSAIGILEGDKVFIAGEESAGMSMAGHVPEKDGILAGLLVAEMAAATGETLARRLQALFAKVGTLHSGREDLHVSAQQVSRHQVSKLLGSEVDPCAHGRRARGTGRMPGTPSRSR